MPWASRRSCFYGNSPLWPATLRHRHRQRILREHEKGALSMLLALPLLAGLLWGLGRGGQLATLDSTAVRYPLLLALAFAPELVLYTPLANHTWWAIHWGPAIYTVSLAVL